MMPEVHDSEVIKIDGIMEHLSRRYQGSPRNFLAFEREATDLFGKIGLRVAVSWNEFAIGGIRQEGAMPEISVTGRFTPFDPDKQVHEVTQNILDLPGQEKGEVIKTYAGGVVRDFRAGGGTDPGHGHPH